MHEVVAFAGFVCCLDDVLAILSDICDTALYSGIPRCPNMPCIRFRWMIEFRSMHLDRDQGIKCQNQGDN